MLPEEVDPKILKQLAKLQEKYDTMGQDLSSYLDGLLYANYLTYWDYIHLDTLLSLQNPKTDFPDEEVFIVYHQITELYFRLVLTEMEQLQTPEKELTAEELLKRVQRINRYFQHLCHSFDIMVDGMEPQQFLKFRMSLLPSSGFQSGQFRFIEVRATDLQNLIATNQRTEVQVLSLEEQYKKLYWRQGATELSTGKKTLTLRMFEKKYRHKIIHLAKRVEGMNLWKLYHQCQNCDLAPQLKQAYRQLDVLANVTWALSHLKAAAHYLQKDAKVISATGGTNWQQYLPPRFQKIMFFPDLWTHEEKENWGRRFVEEELLGVSTERG